MSKKRVHELAKELAIENKELLEILKNKDIEVKSHMSSVDESVADEIRKTLKASSKKASTKKVATKKEETQEEAPKKAPAKKATKLKEEAQEETPKKAPVKKATKLKQEAQEETPKKAPAKKATGKKEESQEEVSEKEPGKKTSAKKEVDEESLAKNEEGSSDDPKPEEKKGKNIVRVFRVENTKQGAKPGATTGRPEGRPQRPRPEGERPVRPRPEGARPVRPVGEDGEPLPRRRPRPDGARPEGARPARPRPDGERPVRPVGEDGQPLPRRRPRPEGERQTRPEGAKPVRAEGARGARPERDASGPRGQESVRPERERPVASSRSGSEAISGEEKKRPVSRPSDREGQQERRTGRPSQSRPATSEGTGTKDSRATRPAGERSLSGRGRPSDQRVGGPRGESRERPAGGGRGPHEGGRPQTGGRPGRPGRGDGPGGTDRRGKDAPPIVEQPRGGRGKAKDKEKDQKRQEGRSGSYDNKARKGKKPVPEVQKPQPKVVKKEEKIKQIILPEVLTIKELADKMKLVPSVIVKKLFLQGKVVTLNQEIDYDTAEEIAMEFDVLCEKEVIVDVIEELLKEEEEDISKMKKRPPVVCVMGHVDHGKTSLLDAIRNANVMDREAGGITQHIGAYTVQINGEDITFLDTPGHEAFTSMRMRGASSTDIAILVVAADDGVMPQTIEAISHAKAAGVEIIVAINKVDKPSANIERVKQELTEYELIPEDWGGSTVFVPVSAKTKEGITELLEMVILTSEVMELKANPNRSARGLVIEGLLDKGKGSVATVLVQKGTLRVGDSIAAGSAYGKVRAMMDHKGKRVKKAGPSMPVEILGLNGVPNAGEVFVGCENEKDARSFGETFISQNRVKMLDDTKSKMSLDDLFTQIHEGNLKELNIIVKADVQGSVEALKQSLLKLSNDEVVIKIIHGGVGAINESDVILASTSNAIIIGFNVRPDGAAKETADQEGVDMRLYRVIYSAIEDVEAAMKGMLDPIFEEKILGHAEIRQIFKASGIGNIAGSYILDGVFERGCKVRITRDGTQIFEGDLASLKRFKDDVKEVRAGYECGLVFADFNDVKEEDKVEAYKMVEVERK